MLKVQNTKPIDELINFCIINVDKPIGPTSFKVCDIVREIFCAKKAGHFGTLDPKVTGVLPVALNRACRLSKYFIGHYKEYVGKMYLHSDIKEKELIECAKSFVGKIMQKPPVKSRVKRILREREVKEFQIVRKIGRIAEFKCYVQGGTYIRKLISDLGEKIGGAHMIELRRTKAGIFSIKNSHKIEEIKEAFKKWKEKNDEKELRKILIPGEIIQKVINKVKVKKDACNGLLNGRPLMIKDLDGKIPDSELICVFCKEKFIGIYRKIENQGTKEDYILAKPELVLN